MRRTFLWRAIAKPARDAEREAPEANGSTIVRADVASDFGTAPFTVAIAGGGASGALLAAELVRRSPDARVIVIEPRESLGRGMAYGTTCPAHLLNVPATRMSAFADEPDDFLTWLGEHHPGSYGPRSFVARAIYGDYLAAVVAAARAAAGPRFQHVRAAATQVFLDGTSLTIGHSAGGEIRADALVVASGNAFPAPWPGIGAALGDGRFFDSPPAVNPDAAGMTDLLDAARKLARGASGDDVDWRASIDSIRPRTNALWQAMSVEDQRRFVRHALPYWNVHRHRMAPEVADALAEMTAADDLRMIAGYTRSIVAAGGRFAVTIELRGKRGVSELAVDRIINCSGPEHDVRKLDNPLLRNLLSQGLLQPHALGVGVDVAENGALRDRAGRDSERLFTLGPIRYGTLIETTAIPEIRVQVRELAALLIGGTRSAASA